MRALGRRAHGTKETTLGTLKTVLFGILGALGIILFGLLFGLLWGAAVTYLEKRTRQG
jgi:hypothetical protein